MARSGQGAGQPARASAARDGSGSAPRPGIPGRGNKAAWRLVALGVVRHVLRSRRFYERVAVAVIALGSLGEISQENRASVIARLSAWSKRQTQRLEREAERQARAVKGTGQVARSGAPRSLAGTMPTRTGSGKHGS